MPVLKSKVINYSQATGPVVTDAYPCSASVAFKNLGGKFVTLDANERLALTVAGDTRVLGWAFVGEVTTNATAGVDFVVVNTSREAKYWMPASGAVTRDLVGKLCDIRVSSGIQQAAIALSTEDTLKIYDVDIANTLVLVGIYDTAAPAGVI